jgi:phosphomannomutase
MQDLSGFKAYDIRGEVPRQINPDLAYQIGRAYASEFQPKKMIVGHDIRLESPSLSKALCDGLIASGVEFVAPKKFILLPVTIMLTAAL